VDTEVEVRFEALGERLGLEQRGWDAVPPANPTRHGFPSPGFVLREAEWRRAMLNGLGGL
jgi:hypothetical protein